MGIIRLTLLTVAGLGGLMWYFGRDNGLPQDRLGRIREEVASAGPLPTQVASAEAAAPDVPQDQTPTAPDPDQGPEVTQPAPPETPEPEPDPEPEVVPDPDPVVPVLYVTGSRVNMRAGPSTGDRVVTALTRGTAVDELAPEENGWSHIRVISSGDEGYMAARFLSGTAP